MSAPPLSAARFDHLEHLRAERRRMLELLAALLQAQRDRGRTPAADGLGAMVIEHGEAEGLLRELAEEWGEEHTRNGRSAFAHTRGVIARRSDEATAAGVPLPLWRARRMFELEPDEYDALLLALVVECDPRAARLVAYLNDHAAQPRPTIGLATQLAQLQHIETDPLAWSTRPLLLDGLLALEGTGPLPTRALTLDDVQSRRLTSLDATPAPTIRVSLPDPRTLDRLVLPTSLHDRVAHWATQIRAGAGTPAVVVTGPKGSGRTALLHAGAGAAGRPLVATGAPMEDPTTALRLLRREARWYGAAIAVELRDTNPTEFWRALGTPPDLILIDAPEQLVPELLAAAPSEPVLWRCELPGPSARMQLWRQALPAGAQLADDDLEALAGAFRFGPAALNRAVRRAEAERGTAKLDRSALAHAGREQVGQALKDLAHRLPLPYRRADLVLPPETERELDLAAGWMRHQAQVLDRWGLGRRVASGRGLTALFAGPPGTGKTMAAQVLSRDLELDCYRIDLSRVVSKYIGETEQNLARVFDEAEAGGAVLFFDEADALFGKRSEVRDARDRYANLEVGYLLQRMEQYDGVAVLASNRMADMDEAFMRRFQVVARFRLPGAAERRRIWAGLLPEECERAADVDLDGLADAVELSGGEIKNCVLAAAYLAAGRGSGIAMGDLLDAIRRELGKSGRLVDEPALQRLAGA
jgi:hypothetical protein